MNYETKVKEILMDCYITGMDEKATQAILSLIREAKIEELEILLNKPGASHDDIYYAEVKRLAELKAEAEL